MKLTKREFEVLQVAAQGASPKYIRGKLSMSPANLYNYMGQLREKGFDLLTKPGQREAKRFLETYPAPDASPVPGLTDRNLFILQKYAAGESYEAIAEALGILPSSVEQNLSIELARHNLSGFNGIRRRQAVMQWLQNNHLKGRVTIHPALR